MRDLAWNQCATWRGISARFEMERVRDLLWNTQLNSYFNRVIEYLSTVPQYQWLVEERDVKRVVAYNHVFKNAHKKVIPTLNANGIATISAKDILQSLSKYVQQPNLKIQDPMLRTIQLINWNGRIEI